MAKWFLTQIIHGKSEHILSENVECSVGRGATNTITLSSAVISRQHCKIQVHKDTLSITDLKSSNGTYVNGIKIPPNSEFTVKESDIVGFGWQDSLSATVNDSEKFVFKVIKEKKLSSKIAFQDDLQNEEEYCQKPDKVDKCQRIVIKQINESKIKSNLSIKRKSSPDLLEQDDTSIQQLNTYTSDPDEGIINLLSDSDNDHKVIDLNVPAKKIKLEPIDEKETYKAKTELNDINFEAFNIKQESISYDDEEPISVDSDSDFESDRRWYIRLSQCSSPGKHLSQNADDTNVAPLNSSYSQTLQSYNDSLFNNIDEDLMDDLITIPHPTEEGGNKGLDQIDGFNIEERLGEQLVRLGEDSSGYKDLTNIEAKSAAVVEQPTVAQNNRKKTLMIEPQHKKQRTPSKTSKSKSAPKSKVENSNTLKDEQKKKLQEIAMKEKKSSSKPEPSSSVPKPSITAAKRTQSNRGAFLMDTEILVKPVSKSETQKNKSSSNRRSRSRSRKTSNSDSDSRSAKKSENKLVPKECEQVKSHKTKPVRSSKTEKSLLGEKSREVLKKNTDYNLPMRPLTDSDDPYSGKPVSKVEPFPTAKPKKKVKFSEKAPEVRVFLIEEGNQLKKTSLVKSTLLDVPRMPMFSQEKLTLMKVLRWNPSWLTEQINNREPPPILGHNNPPINVLHYFQNHTQYMQVIGDLILMEIWECLSQAYTRKLNQTEYLKLSIESLSAVPSAPVDRHFDIFNLSANVSLHKNDHVSLPRVGDVLLVVFGPDDAPASRFFFVHNIRNLPSPPNNIYAFYSLSLHTVYTEKMKSLRCGEVMKGKILTYIKNEIQLFEAMDYLQRSPLCPAILQPSPSLFSVQKIVSAEQIYSQWTATLNESQLEAVISTVSAALSNKPYLQMIQGPPGTGKSSVICSIVTTYFYDKSEKRQQNRGKILICATSNAAVDELVIRLLNIRQKLPKVERFRMVRVGRTESMHPQARDVSSQTLAQRDSQRTQDPYANPQPGLTEEIGRLEARLNMWQSTIQEAKDPGRIAYCKSQIDQIKTRIFQMKSCTREVSAEKIAITEKRIIEGADIIVTTLASAASHKLRGLRGRIAVCIVDEAGQAIEPETLVPLCLDVTKLILIGDPQQLPAFICSQRAKQHGLGESLFARLSASLENRGTKSPVILLNKQYRMHPEIADYPNRAFYGGNIYNAVAIRNDHPLPPYSIVHISSGDKGQDKSGANELEAWGVARLVMALLSVVRPRGMSLAVITPYNAHKDLLRKYLAMLQDRGSPPVEVNTVDSFQGQERDVVVVSLARSQGVGFLAAAARLNVMLTRARHALFVCLNPQAILKNEQWRTLLDDAQRRKVTRFLPNKVCQSGTAAQISNEEILNYIISKNHKS